MQTRAAASTSLLEPSPEKTNTTGDLNTTIGFNADVATGNLQHATAIGAQATVSSSNTIALGRSGGEDTVRVPGDLRVSSDFVVSGASSVDTLIVDTLGSAGALDICRNGTQQISTCSSSLHYKTDVRAFAGGLEIVKRLRPISFKWLGGRLGRYRVRCRGSESDSNRF